MSYDLANVPKADITVKIPDSEYAARCQELRKTMLERNLDIGFVFGTPYLPGDVMYLTGFDTAVENATALITQDKLFVLCGPEGSYVCRAHLRHGDYRIIQELQIPSEEYVNTPTVPIKSVIKEMHPGKIIRVGILTRPDVMTLDTLEMMKKAVGSDAEFIDASDILYSMRFYKSPAELAVLRVSNRICIEAVRAMVESVKPGMHEFEVTAVGDYVMKKMGAYAYGFDSFVTAGERSNTIMGRGTDRIIQDGEVVSIGAAARYEGYASTARRMAVAGGFTRKHIEYYEKIAQAQELAAENFKCGLPRNGIEKAVCDFFRKSGLFQYKIYSVAHGTGISECLEAEAFTMKSVGLIPKNISMMLDVGLYNHPEFHGCSIENPYIINEKGETECLAEAYPIRNWLLY
jgi:Xaa-Pro aminopeptidase